MLARIAERSERSDGWGIDFRDFPSDLVIRARIAAVMEGETVRAVTLEL